MRIDLQLHRMKCWVLWRFVHPQNDHVTLRPKRSSPMDHHQAPPISGSWSPGVARAVDSASLLHGPLRVDRNAETEKKLNGWTDRAWTQRQGTPSTVSRVWRLFYRDYLFSNDFATALEQLVPVTFTCLGWYSIRDKGSSLYISSQCMYSMYGL